MIKTFKKVPIPGFCLRNIHKNKTTKLIKKVVLPTVRPVLIASPSDKTSHGEFPVEEIKIKASPKPKQKTETNRKNPLRQGVNFNSLSNMLKYFAVLKHGNKESKRKAVNNAGKKALKKIKK